MRKFNKITRQCEEAIKGALNGERISVATLNQQNAVANFIELLQKMEINNYTFLCVDGDYYFHINSGVIFIAKQK